MAITEDGQVYSWCSNSDPDREQVQQLGRVSGEGIRSAGRPAPVTGSLTGQKVVQVAIPGEKGGHVVALTVSGEVYEWGPPSWVPRPMPRGSFGGKKIISVACRVDHNLALTEDGRVKQIVCNLGTKLIFPSFFFTSCLSGDWGHLLRHTDRNCAAHQ